MRLATADAKGAAEGQDGRWAVKGWGRGADSPAGPSPETKRVSAAGDDASGRSRPSRRKAAVASRALALGSEDVGEVMASASASERLASWNRG